MNTFSLPLRLLFVGIFLLNGALSSAVMAHQIGDKNGKTDHQHVYKRNAYGKGVTIGHYAQPAGSRGIVIWQASPYRSYAKIRPGFKISQDHAPQPSLKQLYQQKPAFSKDQHRTPDFDKK